MTIVQASWLGTAVFVVSAVIGVVVEDARPVTAAVALALFALGTAVFLVALVRMARRSRDDELSLGGIFFLQGSAPFEIRRHLLGAWTVQIVAAFAAAGVRPFTALAFGVLAPVYGIGLAGLWGVTHGVFGPRRTPGRGQVPSS